jgi:hypothetical protein
MEEVLKRTERDAQRLEEQILSMLNALRSNEMIV